MSGNAPRAVNQAVQKRVKNGGPPETLWTSRHHRVRPEVGEDWGAASMRAAEEQSPQKKRRKRSGKNRGAVKTAGVPQGGKKSEPATQVTGKGRLGGKKEGVEKDDQGHQNRERKEGPGVPEKGDLGVKIAGQKKSWWSGRRAPENGDLGVQIAGKKKSWRSGRRAPETGYLGVQIAGQKTTRRSGRRVPESGYLGVKIAGQKKTWRSGRGVPETGYLGVKIAGQKKTWRSGRWVAKREQTCREKEQPDLAARSEQEKEQGTTDRRSNQAAVGLGGTHTKRSEAGDRPAENIGSKIL